MNPFDLRANLQNVADRAQEMMSNGTGDGVSANAPSSLWRNIVLVSTAHARHLLRSEVVDEAGFDAIARALETTFGTDAPDGSPAVLVREADERTDTTLPREIAGAASLGISRVETLATALRMTWREDALGLRNEVIALRESLLTLADAHAVTIMAATWDRRPANPTTLAHFLGLALGALGTSTTRLEQGIDLVDRSPFGAGVLAGDVLEADRERLSRDLGFTGPIVNTMDALASVEDLVAMAEAAAAALASSRRLMNELLTWIRTEPTSFFLDERWEAYPEPSMPALSISAQLETLVFQLQQAESTARGFVDLARSLPYGPLGAAWDAVANAMDATLTQATAGMIRSREAMDEALIVNRAYLANRAGRAYTTAADLVPFLMSEEAVPPAAARQIASLVVSTLREQNLEASAVTPDIIDSAAVMVIGQELKVEMEALGRYLAPRRFLERRPVLGAPAPEKTREWLAMERERIATDRAWSDERRQRWSAATDELVGLLESAGSDEG